MADQAARTLVNLESPYTGNVELNLLYARFCLHDSIMHHNEAPLASHLLYTLPDVLDDGMPYEIGLAAMMKRSYMSATEKTILYLDLGKSAEMSISQRDTLNHGHQVELRYLPEWLWRKFRETAKSQGHQVEEHIRIS